jgi:nucleotide-binding universal stress UspA family protein
MLDESLDWLRERGVAAEGYLTSGDTIEQILAYTKRLNIDLIVLGHYPRPTGGTWWSNSPRRSLAEATNCCVFVAVSESDGASNLEHKP